MKTKLATSLVLAVTWVLGIATPAQAGLIGATVDVAAYFPDTSSVASDPGNVVVGAGVEYPIGSYSTYNENWSVDVSDNQLIFKWNFDSTGFFLSAPFNGFIMTIISGPLVSSALADAGSAFFPIGIAIVGNQLQLNYSGVTGLPSGGKSIIDFATAPVPEPSTLALIGMALLSLFGLCRMRRGADA